MKPLDLLDGSLFLSTVAASKQVGEAAAGVEYWQVGVLCLKPALVREGFEGLVERSLIDLI